MPLGFIDFPHVAGIASLAVNVRLYELQPLARLCVGSDCSLGVLLYAPRMLVIIGCDPPCRLKDGNPEV